MSDIEDQGSFRASRSIPTCVVAIIAASALAGCVPAEQGPARTARHITCADRFTGEHVFGFWEDTYRDPVAVIGGSSYATVTLDTGKALRVSTADVNVHFDCKVDATRPWGA